MTRAIRDQRIVRLAMLLACAAFAEGALAGPPDCALITQTQGDKFVMGAVIGQGADDPLLSIRLESALNMQFEATETQLADEARIVFCEGRWVASEAEYDSDVARGLNDKRVLLEVWAQAAADLVVMSIVVIPIRHYEFFEESNSEMTGFHRATYVRGESTGMAGALPDLFQRKPALHALTALALGMRYERKGVAENDPVVRGGQLDTARRFYCEADLYFAAAAGELRSQDHTVLANYTKAAVARVANAAVANDDPVSALPIVASERAREGAAGSAATCFNAQDNG